MMGTVRRERFTVRVTRSRREKVVTPTATGGFTETWHRVALPPEDHQVEVEADLDALRNTLGRKALASKGGRAVEAGGLIKAVRGGWAGAVNIQVDMKGLALSLGPKACRSLGGKSVEAGGAVVVRRLKGQP